MPPRTLGRRISRSAAAAASERRRREIEMAAAPPPCIVPRARRVWHGDGERAKLPGGAAASSRRRLEGGQHVCGLKKERGQKKGDKADRKAEYKPCGEMYARQGEMPFISRLVTVSL